LTTTCSGSWRTKKRRRNEARYARQVRQAHHRGLHRLDGGDRVVELLPLQRSEAEANLPPVAVASRRRLQTGLLLGREERLGIGWCRWTHDRRSVRHEPGFAALPTGLGRLDRQRLPRSLIARRIFDVPLWLSAAWGFPRRLGLWLRLGALAAWLQHISENAHTPRAQRAESTNRGLGIGRGVWRMAAPQV
jgi:hypothetical protein